MAPEEQTSAFLLCASETLWFNPSWWNVINEGLPQRRRDGELRGEVDEAPGQSVHRSSLTSVPNGNGITTLKTKPNWSSFATSFANERVQAPCVTLPHLHLATSKGRAS